MSKNKDFKKNANLMTEDTKQNTEILENSAVNNKTDSISDGETKTNKTKNGFGYKLDKFFKLTERGSSVKQEFTGGLVNFLVLSYMLVVIPGLFNGIDGGSLWKALFVATILTTIIATVCMALYVNLPIILAPGIGLVSYIVQLIENGTYSYAESMSICFIAGIVFLVLTLSGLRRKIVDAIPLCIKVAVPTGVGLFILNVGLGSSNSGILDMLNGSATSFAPIVAFVSFIIMVVLYIKNVKGSIFIGIVSGTVLDIIIKLCMKINPFKALTENSWLPPFDELANNSLFKFDFAGLFDGNIVSAILSVLLVVFAVVLIDLFDTVGTLYATAEKGKLLDEKGEVLNMNRAMLVDGCGALVSTSLGLPNTTSYVESTAGVASGARTGLSSLFTSLFFILALFISPLVMLIPVYATSPALILVGLLMFDSVVKIDYKDLSTSIPAILTIIIMPLTSNITFGIAMGLISYTLIMMLTGRFKKVNVFTYIITVLFILYFIMLYIQ